MSEAPLVSICIPTYNNARFLRECLDSINSQTYRNIEVLVGDDGSTDDTVRIINEYVEKYSFKLHRNESNLGAAATSSALVSRSSGEYVAVFHSDDVYHETIVEEAVAVLDRDRSIGIVGSLGNVINSAGEITGEFRLHPEIKKLKKESYNFDDMMLGTLLNKANDIFIVTPSVVARRSAYQDVGLYAEKYKDIYDYEMWLRIARRYNIAIIEKNLMSYRIHENQISEKWTRKNVGVQNIVWILRDYRAYIQDPGLRRHCDEMISRWIMKAARRQNYSGLYEQSTKSLRFVELRKYWMAKLFFMILNMLKISLKKK